MSLPAKNKMKIAMILYRDDLSLGGSLRVVEVLANSLKVQDLEVHLIFAYGEPGPISKKVQAVCHFLKTGGPKDFSGWLRARKLFRQIAPDILHFHNPVYWLHAALTGTKYKKLVHLHGPFFISELKWPDRLLSRIMPRIVNGQVCITDQLRDLVLQRGWGRKERTWTVYNGIDCAHFEDLQSRNQAREVLGLPQGALILAMVCRLAWYKGCQDAVRILAKLDNRWHVVFCGDGPIRSELIALATDLEVEQRIHFTGMLADVRPVYAAADVFLFLSRLEPFGLVIAEAMAARLPVFGLSGAGGYMDARYPLITSENAVMGQRTNPESFDSEEPMLVLENLAERITEFGCNPDRFQPMVNQAASWVRQRFDSSIQARRMIDIYKKLFSL